MKYLIALTIVSWGFFLFISVQGVRYMNHLECQIDVAETEKNKTSEELATTKAWAESLDMDNQRLVDELYGGKKHDHRRAE